MKWSHIFLFILAVAASTGRYVWNPFPPGSENPVVALMALNAPMLLWVAHAWYAAMPGVITFIGGTLVLGVWRVWFEPGSRGARGGGTSKKPFTWATTTPQSGAGTTGPSCSPTLNSN